MLRRGKICALFPDDFVPTIPIGERNEIIAADIALRSLHPARRRPGQPLHAKAREPDVMNRGDDILGGGIGLGPPHHGVAGDLDTRGTPVGRARDLRGGHAATIHCTTVRLVGWM